MTLGEWSGWKIAGVIALWVVAGLALIGWLAFREAAALTQQFEGEPDIALVAIKGWQLGLLLLPPVALWGLWMSSKRG